MDVKVNRITSSEYPIKAKRPKNSMLSKESLVKSGFKTLKSWQKSIIGFINHE